MFWGDKTSLTPSRLIVVPVSSQEIGGHECMLGVFNFPIRFSSCYDCDILGFFILFFISMYTLGNLQCTLTLSM